MDMKNNYLHFKGAIVYIYKKYKIKCYLSVIYYAYSKKSTYLCSVNKIRHLYKIPNRVGFLLVIKS